MGKYTEYALKLKRQMDIAAANATDAVASQCSLIYPRLTGSGELITAGTRINWGGAVKRAALDIWDTPENAPDTAPALWEDIAYYQGRRVIPETITAGTAFALNEPGWWQGRLYRSLADNNVWTPEAYPEYWEVITE